MEAAAALEALRPLLVAARRFVVDGLLEHEHYRQFAGDLLKSLTLGRVGCGARQLRLGPSPEGELPGDVRCQQIVDGPPKPPLAGSGALPGNELDHLVEAEKKRLRLSGITVPTALDSSSGTILETMRRANLGMSMNSSSHSSPQMADESDSDASKRRRLDLRGEDNRRGESSSNVVTFHPDCDKACCDRSDCIHTSRVPVILYEPGHCTSFMSSLVHDGSNESDDEAFLNVQLFVKSKAGKARRGGKTFASGVIDRGVAERAGRSVAAGFYDRFSGYSLGRRMYQGKYLSTSIEFPEELFDENLFSAAVLERTLGSELYALKLAAEDEFRRKHGTEVSTFKIWASWKLPDCLERRSDSESNGTFDKHLDYPAHPLMLGTVVVATMFRSVADYQVGVW